MTRLGVMVLACVSMMTLVSLIGHWGLRAGANCTDCGQGGNGPDVIVGDLSDRLNYASEGGYESFAVGTVSCNIGNQQLLWISNNNQHPVIGQNFFKLDENLQRFEHLAQSWLKHGFTALQQNACGCGCIPSGTGTRLGVGCSDPYGAGLNGEQSSLRPKYEVNAHNGFFPASPSSYPGWSGTVARRMRIPIAELLDSSIHNVRYFVEGQYVTADDSLAGNAFNNASYREMIAGGGGTTWTFEFAVSSTTVRGCPAIRAWKATNPLVTETDILTPEVGLPGQSLVIVSSLATDLHDGWYQYEYAVHNLNSDRSIREFRVPCGEGVAVQAIGFHDVSYHDGEPWEGTDWPGRRVGNEIVWETDTYASNPNANAIRWGTLYNFRFKANYPPEQLNVTLGLFKPGDVGDADSVQGLAQTPPSWAPPPDCNSNGVEDWQDIADGTSLDCNQNQVPDECETFQPCTLTSKRIATGLASPVGVYAAPGDVDRLFIVEQVGRIRILHLDDNTLNALPFLDISSGTSGSGERGLLSMAFHPNFASNGYFYVNYTNLAGNTVISRFNVSSNPDIANVGSETVLRIITQDFGNHNGGQLQFGPDGMMYCAMGDGGSANDPNNRAQSDSSLLGKMLRLNVDNPPTYTAGDNPNLPGWLPDVWAKGLRNPWRFSFDRLRGDMWIADVGQESWEEVNFVSAEDMSGGFNFGWRCMEGLACTGHSGCTCNSPALTLPIHTESHDFGGTCSISGGYVYRGCAMPWLQGTYFYGDFCGDYIRTFRYDGISVTEFVDRTAELQPDIGSLTGIVSFGEDASGEMYIVSHHGSVFKVICEETNPAVCGNNIIEIGEQCDPPSSHCDCNCQIIQAAVIFHDDFETDKGWTTESLGATSGQWQRGIPVNDPNWAYDPFVDGDGSGQCWLTHNAFGNTDVDNGAVRLNSPNIDMTAGQILIQYYYYLYMTLPAGVDRLLVEISSNGAAGPWIVIADHNTDGGTSWRQHAITQQQLDAAGVTLTSTMRLRFTANDADPQSIVEAGLDGFRVTTTSNYSDCNGNCINDVYDILFNTSLDCNDNGVPDECEGGGVKSYPITVSPPLVIPDGTDTYVSHSFTVPDSGIIEDLDLGLVINHTWNGDLTVRLSHSGVTVILIDRPGYSGSGFGWDNDGFNIILNDEGSGGPIENVNTGGPAVTSPPDFMPHNPLSAFDGMNKQGIWTIEVKDSASDDTGTLNSWELIFTNVGTAIESCDCNENGINDATDILTGFSTDCNGNLIPDECEIAANPLLDCDGGPTGVIAAGDLLLNTFCFGCHNSHGGGGQGFPGPNIRNKNRVALWNKLLPPTSHPGGVFPGFSDQDFADLEAFLADGGSRGRPDRILDSCQLLPDCDHDGTSDGCELETGTQLDMDYDGRPDDCGPINCPEDIAPPGGDGVVSVGDINAVLIAFGQPCNKCPQDISPPGGDGQVTIADVVQVLQAFGPCN